MIIEEIAERIKNIERSKGKRPSKKKLLESASSILTLSEIVVDLAETKVKEGDLGTIHLIGIDHVVQHLKTNPVTKKFKSYLTDQVSNLKITLLAEEWNEDYCHRNEVKKSTVKEVADEIGLEHRYCEMRNADREARDLYSDTEVKARFKREGNTDKDELSKTIEDIHRKREQHWYSQIKDVVRSRDIIFVCGGQHLESFESLLKQNGINVRIFRTKFDRL